MLFAVTSCDTTVKTDEAIVGDAITTKEPVPDPSHTFVVDTAKSDVTWIGAKMTGRHNGIFKVAEGELYMHEGLITGGRMVLDVAAMHSEDKAIDAKNNEKLTNHLRSADFFDVARYPTAVFELTGMAPFDSTGKSPQATQKYSEYRIKNPTHRITGNLTIKDQTKSISFPAKVTLQDGTLQAIANFNIDRTKWGLVYRSDNSLGDKTIYPEVNIGLHIVAHQQTP